MKPRKDNEKIRSDYKMSATGHGTIEIGFQNQVAQAKTSMPRSNKKLQAFQV